MKSILAAKVGSIRKRSGLTSSSTSEGAKSCDLIPKEPSLHHGKMLINDEDEDVDHEQTMDIVFCISIGSIHALSDIGKTIVFEAAYHWIKEIEWDHTGCSVRFVLEDSSTFTFLFSCLADVESQLSAVLLQPDLTRVPEQVYVGVMAGRNIPSPIQQRRPSGPRIDLQYTMLPPSKRRELLGNERPPQTITSRETLGLEYFRTGILSFACTINGDPRGIKLDLTHLYIYPSSDCHDRTACLFSYLYEMLETCEVRGTRVELRFRRSETKQPTFIACQSADAIYIRDAIWYLKSGDFIDSYYRGLSIDSKTNSSSPRGQRGRLASMSSLQRRRKSLMSSYDEYAIDGAILSSCPVIGCTRHRESSQCRMESGKLKQKTSGNVRSKKNVWFCEEHAPVQSPPSPPKSPSRRDLFSREKAGPVSFMVHSKHYLQSLQYHSVLAKYGGKYQLTKSWNPKFVALIETPVGGFLCYYDKLAHCPGLYTAIPKERRVIDLSSVICIRPQSTVSQAHSNAFDLVTVYRTWTFAACSAEEYDVWMHLLTEAVLKHTSMTPDKVVRYLVQVVRDPFHVLSARYEKSAIEITSHGVTVYGGSDGKSEVYTWYFTEIQKWSVVVQQGETCVLLTCLASGTGPDSTSAYHDFIFQTPEAANVCHIIEFYVGKCLAKLEVLSSAYAIAQRPSRRPSEANPLRMDEAFTTMESQSSMIKVVGDDKQIVLENVPLRSIGLLPLKQANPVSDETLAAMNFAPVAKDIPAPVPAPVTSLAIIPHPSTVPRPYPFLGLTIDISPKTQATMLDSLLLANSLVTSQSQLTEFPEKESSLPLSTNGDVGEFDTGVGPSDSIDEISQSVVSLEQTSPPSISVSTFSVNYLPPIPDPWSAPLEVFPIAPHLDISSSEMLENDNDRFESFSETQMVIISESDSDGFQDAREQRPSDDEALNRFPHGPDEVNLVVLKDAELSVALPTELCSEDSDPNVTIESVESGPVPHTASLKIEESNNDNTDDLQANDLNLQDDGALSRVDDVDVLDVVNKKVMNVELETAGHHHDDNEQEVDENKEPSHDKVVDLSNEDQVDVQHELTLEDEREYGDLSIDTIDNKREEVDEKEMGNSEKRDNDLSIEVQELVGESNKDNIDKEDDDLFIVVDESNKMELVSTNDSHRETDGDLFIVVTQCNKDEMDNTDNLYGLRLEHKTENSVLINTIELSYETDSFENGSCEEVYDTVATNESNQKREDQSDRVVTCNRDGLETLDQVENGDLTEAETHEEDCHVFLCSSPRVPIPEYTKRLHATYEYVPPLDYDETLEPMVVYTVHFPRSQSLGSEEMDVLD